MRRNWVPRFIQKVQVRRAKQKRGIPRKRIDARMKWLNEQVAKTSEQAKDVFQRTLRMSSQVEKIFGKPRRGLLNQPGLVRKIIELQNERRTLEPACQAAMKETQKTVAALYRGILFIRKTNDPEKKKKIEELLKKRARLRTVLEDLNRILQSLKRMGQQMAVGNN